MQFGSFSLVLVLLGSAAAGCATVDGDTEEGHAAKVQAVAPASAFVLTVSGLEGEDVMSPGRDDVCTNGRCSFAYIAGTAVAITPYGSNAVADCEQFSSWSGACAGQGTTCSLVINSDLAAASHWSKILGCVPQ